MPAPTARSRIQSSRRRKPTTSTCSRATGREREAYSITGHDSLNPRLLAEPVLEDLERSRRSHRAAVTAVLDHGADDDRRPLRTLRGDVVVAVERAPAAPPRLV